MRKLMTVLLVIAMVFVMVACNQTQSNTDGTKNEPKQTKEKKSTQAETKTTEEENGDDLLERAQSGTFPLVDEPVEMTLATLRAPNGGYWEDKWYWQFREKQTNVKFIVEQVAWESRIEKTNLMFATGELPDVLMKMNITEDDQVNYGEQGLLADLNQYLDYAPDLAKLFERQPQIKAMSIAPDGNMYTLPFSQGGSPYKTVRVFINQVWLDTLGLNTPETLDDLYDVLIAFRDNDPNGNGEADEIPFGGIHSNNESGIIILSALGYVNAEFNVKDGVVEYTPYTEAWEEYIKFMARLHEEKLLDPQFFTQDLVAMKAKAAANRYGLMTTAAPYVSVGNERYVDWESLIPLTSDMNDTKMWTEPQIGNTGTFAISSDCEYPELAMAWANYGYTEQGAIHTINGPLDGSEEAMGFTGYTEPEPGLFTRANHEDYNGTWHYECQMLVPMGGGNPPSLNTEGGRFFPQLKSDVEAAWRDSISTRVYPHSAENYPFVLLSADEIALKQEIIVDLGDYVESATSEMITGGYTPEKMQEFYDTLEQLRVQELVDLQQKVYDRYSANLK